MAELSALTLDKSSGDLLMNLPSGIRSEFGGLVAASWRAEYYDALNHTDRDRAVKFAKFLGELEDGDSDENIQLMQRQTARLAAGDIISLVISYEYGQKSLGAFARGRLYSPRNIFKRLIKRPYAYLPDALGREAPALGKAVDATADRLKPHEDKDIRVVVDAFAHDEAHQHMLRSLGFQAARQQTWVHPTPFSLNVGETQAVQQYETTQNSLSSRGPADL